jgi:hypothetical protein
MPTPTTTYALSKPTVGGDDNAWGTEINSALDKIDDLFDGTTAIKPNLDAGLWKVGGVAVTSTAAELNILDGVTASTAELNILDGVTASTAELNILDGVTSTAAELNILDGVTATTAELNILDGVTATAAELNILDGVTATASELNYVDITTLGVAQASKALTVAANGTITFSGSTGTSGQVLTSGGSSATPTWAGVLGVGQTWQLVTRVITTSYQNTTGQPIFVSYYSGATFEASTDNVTFVTVQPPQVINSANRNYSYAVIPNGHYYRLTGALGGSTHFAELR